MTNQQRIRKAVQEIVRLAPRAVDKGLSWSRCFETIQFAVNLETMTKQTELTDDELLPYFEHIKEKRDYLRAVVRGRPIRKR